MRHLRSAVPALVTALAVAVGGSAVALAGAGPASSANVIATSGSATGSGSSPVTSLLAGSYQPEFARLSVGADKRITSRSKPTVSGKPRLGSPLLVSPGTWRPTQVVMSYQWYAGSSPISGADGPSYTPVAGVVGDDLTVRVTASRAGHRASTVVAEAGTVQPGALRSVTAPKVRGNAAVGKTLTVTPGTWSPIGVKVSYEWMNGRKVVSRSQRYTVKASDRRDTLRVAVTATRPGYKSMTVLTKPTRVGR